MSFSTSSSKSEEKPLFGETAYSTTATVGARPPTYDEYGNMIDPGSKGTKKIILDRSIRGRQERGMSLYDVGNRMLGQATGQFGSSLGDLRSRLFSNQDPYMQARIAPMEQAYAQERAGLEQSLGRRGLGGSSFGQQALTSQNVQQQQALANERALATQQSIDAGLTIDQLMLQARQAEAQGNLKQADYLRAIADDRAKVEVALMTATNKSSSSSGMGFGIGMSAANSGGSD